MKCPCCNGTGIDDDRLTCYECGGTGEVEMTEQEWLQTANAEQLAEELLMATMSDVLYAKIIPCKTHEDAIRVVREWLKQPHKPIS